MPRNNPRSEVCPEISSFPDIPELHLRYEMPNFRQKTRPLRLINFDELNLAGDGGSATPPLMPGDLERCSEPEGLVYPFLYGQVEYISRHVSRAPELGVNEILVAPVDASTTPSNAYLASHLGKDGSIPKFSGERCDFDNFR